MDAKKYLLDIGFDDAHLPELFNDNDKSTYTMPELMQSYLEHKLKISDKLKMAYTDGFNDIEFDFNTDYYL